jgi:PAS domain S-box-containing protein
MKNVKFNSEKGTPTQAFAEKQSGGSSILFHAIENADGVPFQLIFGQHIGEGYYLRVGDGIEKLLGIAPGDFTEKRYHDMIEEVVPLSGNIPSDPAEARRRIMAGEVNTYRTEVLIKTPSGERKWIRDTSLPYADIETGKIIGVFGILTDITDSKQSQLDITEARKNSEEYERLKLAFLRNISHEIRTPLNAIVGFATLLCEEPRTSPREQEFKNIIIRSTDHLLRVMTDILEMSGLESGTVTVKKESVNIRRLLENLHHRFAERITEKGIGFRFTYTSAVNGDVIEADGHMVIRMFETLLANAIKFTKVGGIEFGCDIKEGVAEFYVSDTGTGISEENRGEVFKRFYQAETSPTRNYGGIGLGLTIAREYAVLMGGDIWFETKVGEGSRFMFTIPNKV